MNLPECVAGQFFYLCTKEITETLLFLFLLRSLLYEPVENVKACENWADYHDDTPGLANKESIEDLEEEHTTILHNKYKSNLILCIH